MISILLPVFNGERYIKKSIDSIINQTFKDFELLIGFNGTTDSSREIVDSYTDNRIKIFEYEERGKAKTLNKLIKESSFDWIAIQDDDDVWSKYKLEYQIKYIKEYDVIGTYIEYINENDKVTGFPNLHSDHETIAKYSLNGNNQIANSSAIFKFKDASEIDGWGETLDGIEDYDFWLKLLKKNKKFFNVPFKLVRHRLHKNSNFNTKPQNIEKLFKKI
jgi:glycosyltransferase involved in cell wall biosynthesis